MYASHDSPKLQPFMKKIITWTKLEIFFFNLRNVKFLSFTLAGHRPKATWSRGKFRLCKTGCQISRQSWRQIWRQIDVFRLCRKMVVVKYLSNFVKTATPVNGGKGCIMFLSLFLSRSLSFYSLAWMKKCFLFFFLPSRVWFAVEFLSAKLAFRNFLKIIK